MVFPAHWLLRIEGEFRQQGNLVLETWSNSIRFSGAGTTENPVTWLETVAVPAIESFYSWGNLAGNVYVVAAKFNAIDPDGRYASQDETNVYFWEGGEQPKGTSTAIVEPQRSLAVSWTTAVTRGRASKGRIFLPGFTPSVGADMLIPSSTATDVEIQAEGFLQGLSQGDYTPAIVSGVGQGTLRPITGVRVGRVVDTQRRRRRSLPETYVNALADDQ